MRDDVIDFYRNMASQASDPNPRVRWDACAAADAIDRDYSWAYSDRHPRVRARAVTADCFRLDYRHLTESQRHAIAMRINKARDSDPSPLVQAVVLFHDQLEGRSVDWIFEADRPPVLRTLIEGTDPQRWYDGALFPGEYDWGETTV